jgi:hypothetical protein
VKLIWIKLRAAIFVSLLVGGIGCGGLNASHTVTPASFFLPGLGQVTPPSGETNGPSHNFAAVGNF